MGQMRRGPHLILLCLRMHLGLETGLKAREELGQLGDVGGDPPGLVVYAARRYDCQAVVWRSTYL